MTNQRSHPCLGRLLFHSSLGPTAIPVPTAFFLLTDIGQSLSTSTAIARCDSVPPTPKTIAREILAAPKTRQARQIKGFRFVVYILEQAIYESQSSPLHCLFYDLPVDMCSLCFLGQGLAVKWLIGLLNGRCDFWASAVWLLIFLGSFKAKA